MYLYINLPTYAARSAIYRRTALDNQATWPKLGNWCQILSFPLLWRWITATTTTRCVCAWWAAEEEEEEREAAVWNQILSWIFRNQRRIVHPGGLCIDLICCCMPQTASFHPSFVGVWLVFCLLRILQQRDVERFSSRYGVWRCGLQRNPHR